jgi:hypothetical protein
LGIEYRPSDTWPAEAGQDESTPLGDESTVIGYEDDSALKLMEMLTGRPPINRIVRVLEITVTVPMKKVIEAVVR